LSLRMTRRPEAPTLFPYTTLFRSLRTTGAGDTARKWLIDNVPAAYVLSQGQSIEIFKGVGDPRVIADRLDLESRTGTHAIGHTRDRKSTRLNSSHVAISYAVFCLK